MPPENELQKTTQQQIHRNAEPQQIQQNQQQEQMGMPKYNTDFTATDGSWEVMSRDEVALASIDTETRYKVAPVTKEEKKNMKKFLKSEGKIRDKFDTTDISNLAVWAQASKEVDGAGSDFERLSDTLYSFATSYNKYQSLDPEKNRDAMFEKDDEAVNMIKAAKKYIAVHGKRQFTEKGKNRMALAKYIVSRKFLTKYLVTGSFVDGRKQEKVLSSGYDVDAFIFEHMYRKANMTPCAFVNDKSATETLKKFGDKYGREGDNRKQYSVLFSEDEKQNKKTLEAIKKATSDEPDMTDIFRVFDQKVDEILKFKLTPEMYSKEFILKNPTYIAHIIDLAFFSADFFEKNARYDSIGLNQYIENLKKNHPEVVEAFNKKSLMISEYGTAAAANINIWLSISVTNVRKELMGFTDLISCRNYGFGDEDDDGNDEKTLASIEMLKKRFETAKIENKDLTATYSFNRMKNKARTDQINNDLIAANKKEYEEASQENEGVTKESLEMLNFIKTNDARRQIEFYIPKDSHFEKKLKAAMKNDRNKDDDIDRALAGMLKTVRFDGLGDPLPEYVENYNWNIHWIQSYAKALSFPDQRIPEYEQCLKGLIEWGTSEENIKKFEEICKSRSYEKNPDDMSFFIRMNEISLKLFNNHIEKCKVAEPFLKELGDKKKEIEDKMNYVSALGLYYSLDSQAKYQISFSNYQLSKADIGVNSPMHEVFKEGYKESLDKAAEKYNQIKS